MANVKPAANPSASERVLPLLLLLFAASGCAALIYEIVWFQLLELVIGSSTRFLGMLPRTLLGGAGRGRRGPGRSCAVAGGLRSAPSTARLRRAGARHRRQRDHRAVRLAVCGRHI